MLKVGDKVVHRYDSPHVYTYGSCYHFPAGALGVVVEVSRYDIVVQPVGGKYLVFLCAENLNLLDSLTVLEKLVLFGEE